MLTGTWYLANLDPTFKGILQHFLIPRIQGMNVQIVSGYRSPQLQAQLYAKGRSYSEIVRGVKKYGKGGAVTDAPPGWSPHNYGLAIDLAGSDMPKAMSIARDLGFGTVSWDPGHVEWPDWARALGLSAGRPQLPV